MITQSQVGCLNYNYKHGGNGTKLHMVWRGMKYRCSNKNSEKHKWHGMRGISVCDEWKKDFSAFRDWALANGYREGLSIDRIDNDGNYEPSNCRWVTAKEQNNNKRTNIKVEFNGKIKTISEWSDETGIDRTTLTQRLKRGWSAEKAFAKQTRETTTND